MNVFYCHRGHKTETLGVLITCWCGSGKLSKKLPVTKLPPCPICGSSLPIRKETRGRHRITCSVKCRVALYRQRLESRGTSEGASA